MSTPDTVTLLIRTVLKAAGLIGCTVRTQLVEDDRFFETTVTGADPHVAAIVLRGHHRGAYGTSVRVSGSTVICRELNK